MASDGIGIGLETIIGLIDRSEVDAARAYLRQHLMVKALALRQLSDEGISRR